MKFSHQIPAVTWLTHSRAAALPMAVLLAACGPDTQPPVNGAIRGETAMPSIYIDQIIQPYRAESRRQLYDELLEACRETDMPIRELSAADLERVGTVRLQRWFEEGRVAYRWESWNYRQGDPQSRGLCQFHLISDGRHVLVDDSGLRGIGLNNDGHYDESPLTESDARYLARFPVNDLPPRGGQMREVAGQPCVQTSVPGFEEVFSCTWTGGTQWGFGPRSNGMMSIAIASHSDFFSTVILEQGPGGQLPDRVTTVRFEIGGTLDESAMQPAPATAWPAARPLP